MSSVLNKILREAGLPVVEEEDFPVSTLADVRFEYSGFHTAQMQNEVGDWHRHVIWCPRHFALVLDVSSPDEAFIGARLIAFETLPLARRAEKIFLIGERHQCFCGIAEPLWKHQIDENENGENENGENETGEIAARLFLLSRDGFSGIGVSRVETPLLSLRASPPLAIEFDAGRGRAVVQCEQPSTLLLNGTRFDLEVGRHQLPDTK